MDKNAETGVSRSALTDFTTGTSVADRARRENSLNSGLIMNKTFAEPSTATSGHYRVGFNLRCRCNMKSSMPSDALPNNNAVSNNHAVPDKNKNKDDRATLIAISVLACFLQDILHEGLGHGVTAWLSGAHTITLSTVALQADIDTRWISANGT